MMRCWPAGLAFAMLGGLGVGAPRACAGTIDPAFDYHSYANVDQFRVRHLELDLRVDL